MRIARFKTDGAARLGLVVDAGVIDIAAHLPDAPDSMTGLFGRWAAFTSRLQALAAQGRADYPLETVVLLSPIERPGKIMGIGLNYADHAAEAAMELPADQLWFSKASTAINDPFGAIQRPKVSGALDYEAELVAVIGRRCRHVSREEARTVIFGYCVGNDVTVRDWQFKTSQFVLGKSFDTHAPIGPWIVTADAIDPHNLEIRSYVNGEERQHSNTRHFIFDCYAMVEHLSKAMTLEPGDLIFTGTPSGVGAVMKPPKFLAAGDVVRVEIDGIGAIENHVVNE
jgi:2-keto-4-pentenoate hydratase/2-oxohepta-3-ene-1,7-dioic acid hydratase in catechol pathway